MTDHDYHDPSCKSCDFSQGREIVGSIVHLPGPWSLNHYSGSEGYLGWMALQPYWHRDAFSDFRKKELTTLGPNIAKIEATLKAYWLDVFRDPIERLYVIYFFEGGGPYHPHLHLIPRFQSLEPRLRAWKAPCATISATFPARYRRGATNFNDHVCCLMDHLKHSLADGHSPTA
jgi:diadenosine tetraphosphate (Ap4A) HIT family hydrolase